MTPTWMVHRALSALVIVVAASLLVGPSPAHSASAPTARFDWRMRDRFGDVKQFQDWVRTSTVVDFHYNPLEGTYDPAYVHPKAWTVVVDACASEAGAPNASILSYRWEIDGTRQEPISSCTYLHEFNALGPHQAKLTATRSDGRADTVAKEIVLREFLMVSIGDSYASGQGNPDAAMEGLPRDETEDIQRSTYVGPVWQDARCARSAKAGPAKAAIKFQEQDPGLAVTYLPFACSGATIVEGLVGSYDGAVPPLSRHGKLLPQIEAVARAVCDGEIDPTTKKCTGRHRRIDALVLSVGGDDWHFAGIIIRCVIDLDCSTDPRIREWIKTDLDALFAAVHRKIVSLLDVSRVFIAQYPDPTQDRDGQLCDRVLGGFDHEEIVFAHNEILVPLNRALHDAASTYGWLYVDGIMAGFARHGYCAGPEHRWFRTFPESLGRQGNLLGTMHPNEKGHELYKERIYACIAQPHACAPTPEKRPAKRTFRLKSLQ